MDELTRERHPYPIPWKERTARPTPRPRAGHPQPVDGTWGHAVDNEVVARRRLILCGCDDLATKLQGGNPAELAMVGHRRLAETIRTWVA